MTVITLYTADLALYTADHPKVASGNKDSVQALVNFDSKWDGYAKSGIFHTAKSSKEYESVMTSNRCIVPKEVLAEAGHIFISVRGVSSANGKVKQSAEVRYKVEKGSDGMMVFEPSPDVYRQLLSAHGSIEQALAVERARINNLARLPEGSTAGDAELIDGRIDNNGVAWATVGNNVRAIGDMNTLLSGAASFIYERIDTVIINGWVDIRGEYLSNSSSGDTHKCVQINVNVGEHYLIYSEYGWEMPDAVAQKADGTPVAIFNKSSVRTINNFDKVITIPDGAEKLTVNCMSDFGRKPVVAKITGCSGQVTPAYLTNALSSVRDKRKLTGDNLITETKKAYSLKAGEEFAVESGDTQFSVGECAVEAGKVYAIKTGAGFMCNPYVFYNASGIIIGELIAAPQSEYQTYDIELIAPLGAAMIKVTQYGGNLPEVREVIGHTNAEEWCGLKWVCVGDSLTEENERTTKHYFDYISEKTGISIVNMGIGGTGYKRGEENSKAFYQRIGNVPTDADVITIFGSGNDLSYINVLGTPTDTGTDTLCGCVNTTIDNLYAVFPMAQIGIVSPTPWINNQPSDNGSMSLYAEALKEICALRGIPFLDLFRTSGFRPNDETYRKMVFSKDDGNGVHPDETGHKIIAPRFKAFLESIIL